MRQINHDAKPLHLLDKGNSCRCQPVCKVRKIWFSLFLRRVRESKLIREVPGQCGNPHAEIVQRMQFFDASLVNTTLFDGHHRAYFSFLLHLHQIRIRFYLADPIRVSFHF